MDQWKTFKGLDGIGQRKVQRPTVQYRCVVHKHRIDSKDGNCLKGTGSPDEYVFEGLVNEGFCIKDLNNIFYATLPYIRHLISAGCYDNDPWYLGTNLRSI